MLVDIIGITDEISALNKAAVSLPVSSFAIANTKNTSAASNISGISLYASVDGRMKLNAAST